MLASAAQWGARGGLIAAALILVGVASNPNVRHYVGAPGAVVLGLITALVYGTLTGLTVFVLVLLVQFVRRRRQRPHP